MFKSLKFWLALSLCLNLFLVGLFAGGVFIGRKMGGNFAPPANEISAMMRGLPQEHRKAVINEMRQAGGPPERLKLRQLADLIDQEPFDMNALEAYLTGHHGDSESKYLGAQKVLLQKIADMSDAERDAMAEKLREIPENRAHKKRRP